MFHLKDMHQTEDDMTPRKRTDEKPIPLMVRLPPDLHALVVDAAFRQHRSLNAQLIHIVAWYFGGEFDNDQPVKRPD
jgi:predicted HicB family RNase H-like nuclease